MENTNPHQLFLSESEKKLKRSKLFLTIAVLILTGTILIAGIYTYLHSSRTEEVIKIQNKITEEQKKIDILTKVEKIPAAFISKEALDQLLEKRVFWSSVIAEATRLKPENIVYRSYSAQTASKISLNILGPSYFAVADLLDIFSQKSLYFKNPFIPTIARGIDAQGNAKFNFNLNADLTPIITKPLNSSGQVVLDQTDIISNNNL